MNYDIKLKWQIEADGHYDLIIEHESYSEERREFIDYHIYLDIDYEDEIPLDTVIQNVKYLINSLNLNDITTTSNIKRISMEYIMVNYFLSS